MKYTIVSKKQGALHIDGLEAATQMVAWGYDGDKIEENGYVPYQAQSACGALTSFGSFRWEHSKFDDLAEVRKDIETSKLLSKKICKRCEAALLALGY
jgi:hypothetical protein